MPAKILLDTNIWVYLYAKNPAVKHQVVQQIMADQLESIAISAQIMGELFTVLTRKNLTSAGDAQAIITEIATTVPVLPIEPANVLLALDINSRYHYSYWTSLVIATGLLSGCHTLYSEDMQHQQVIDGKLEVVNPFAGA